MKASLTYGILLCVTSVGFLGWRVHAVKSNGTPQFEIVEDPSRSHPEDCQSLLGLAEEVFDAKGTAPNSSLTILVLGSQVTAN